MPSGPPKPSGPTDGQLIIYQDGVHNLQVRLDGQTVWLTQAQLADLYQTTPQNITLHIAAIYGEGELIPEATCKDYLQVRSEGARTVERSLKHYSLDIILAVGYRVRSPQGTRFRQWATSRLAELLTKGFTLDDERIKAGRSIGQDYFDELLARIRDIRSSERLFYQKITDIYSTSIDYDSNAAETRTFFQTVQNKMHFAAHGSTAAAIVRKRADANRPNMGLTTWKNAPSGPIRRPDVAVAKNYLSQQELQSLNLVVSAYLDFAELQASNKRPMYMRDWITKLDDFLRLADHKVLTNAGSVSHNAAETHASQEFDKYDAMRIAEESASPNDFDRIAAEVKQLSVPSRKRHP